MRLIVLSLTAAAALAGCTEPSAPSASDPAPATSASTDAAPPSGAEAPPPAHPADACGAAGRQDWIGRARTELPAAPAGPVWRVYEIGQPVTQDLRPDRLNIEIDPDTGTVVRLGCG